MRPEDLLTDEFLKQFKSRETLNDFLGQLQKRGIEKQKLLIKDTYRHQ